MRIGSTLLAESMSLTKSSGLYLFFILHLLPSVSSVKNLPPYTPTDLILLNCGASSSAKSLDGRVWEDDSRSKFLDANSKTVSLSLDTAEQDPTVTLVPYMTARTSLSNFSYTFPASPGPKFLRLYFFPATYPNLNITTSYFSVRANDYALLTNFSAFITVSALNSSVKTIIKEYILTVRDDQKLSLMFSASSGSFAFINGIEVVSMPNNLYIKGSDNPLTYVGIDFPFYSDNTTALELFYRLNVGGKDIGGPDDTGMYRAWLQDSDYLFGAAAGIVAVPRPNKTIKYTKDTPPYTAPALVYSTYRSMGPDPRLNLRYNLTWLFPVDAGFHYLVRLHFCETRVEVTDKQQLMFFIFINNQTAETAADVINWSGGISIPVFKDYVVWVPEGNHIKKDLWLALHPVAERYGDAILNGLEIFKINNSAGSLAGSNPELIAGPSKPEHQHSKLPERGKSQGLLKIMIVVGSVFGAVLILSLVICFLALKQRRKKNAAKTGAKSFRNPLSFMSRSNTRNVLFRPSVPFRRFSIFEIEVATTKFDEELIIGSGGFGDVYKGYVDDGTTKVAIKRLHSSSRQGAREFRTEIQMLSKVQCPNLVSLIGYCNDPGEMILVYEYMHRGTLRDHLYKAKNPPLPWKQRLGICIGAAKGLHYLHTGVKPPIIHRDVKSTNILIDENWVAKVSDFGLSRTGPTSNSQTHVSTVVRGSFGYVDPEYYRRQHLTEKSDVYSFGVVLLEVLCGRPPVIPGLSREQVNLADWARICYRRGALNQIVDPNLMGQITPACLEKFGEIVESCLRDKGTLRPAMSDVVFGLELVLQLQEDNGESGTTTGIADVAPSTNEHESPLLASREVVSADDDNDSGSAGQKDKSKSSISSWGRSVAQSDPDRFRSAAIFSEIMSPKGR